MKQSNFEESARAPLIFAGAGVTSRGIPCPSPVEFVDIFPTVAELTGLNAPPNLAGKSLRPLLDDPAAEWNRPAFTQVQRGKISGHSVRTRRWRYIEWDNGRAGSQLYDHDNDPREIRNLVNTPANEEVVAELKAVIRSNWPVDAYSNSSTDE